MLGAETLVRWRHADRGLIPPAEFIPVAERRGLIRAIGDFVLNEACRQIAAWTSANACPEQLTIGVNISGRELRDPELVKRVAATLNRHGVAPSRLVLEITESVMLGELGAAHHAIEGLARLGVRIALDDFGTGYSSLTHLRQLLFDRIKIDRSFVAELTTRAESAAIVSAVIALGNSLGVGVTAEGVETHDQLALLRAAGCVEVQGYYLARPMPLTGVLERLAAGDAKITAA